MTPVVGYKIQLILIPDVEFFITATSRSVILVVVVQLLDTDADSVNVSVYVYCQAGISITEEVTQ